METSASEQLPSEFAKTAIRHRIAQISRNSKPATEILKLVLIGATNSGKTSMLLRFVERRFDAKDGAYQNTIGVDFKMKTLEIDGAHVAKV